MYPSIAALDDGGFVVTWQDSNYQEVLVATPGASTARCLMPKAKLRANGVPGQYLYDFHARVSAGSVTDLDGGGLCE